MQGTFESEGLNDNAIIALNSTAQIQLNDTKFQDGILNFSELALFGLNTNQNWWENVGRLFFILYWLHLSDLGQISQSSIINDTPPSASSNIFVNESLYDNYITYIQTIVEDAALQKNATFTFLPVNTMTIALLIYRWLWWKTLCLK